MASQDSKELIEGTDLTQGLQDCSHGSLGNLGEYHEHVTYSQSLHLLGAMFVGSVGMCLRFVRGSLELTYCSLIEIRHKIE